MSNGQWTMNPEPLPLNDAPFLKFCGHNEAKEILSADIARDTGRAAGTSKTRGC